jgi:hypothetical protein
MADTQPVYDIAHWDRVGRGKTLQFIATDEEVRAWLLESLPAEYQPYFLVGMDLVKEARKKYLRVPFRFPLANISQCLDDPGNRRHQFWILSERISPSLRFRKGDPIDAICSINGLVEVYHGFTYKDGRRGESWIGIVDRVRRVITKEIRRHDSYLKIYSALKSTISCALVYSTIHTFANGSEIEDSELIRMTAAAVRAYEAGVPFFYKPGRLLVS